MKRRRPEPWAMRNIRLRAYFGKVIPPRSVVKLLADWGDDRGRIFRIGYYSRQDGLNCVWLVNEAGTYEQTADQESIERDFEVLGLGNDTDLYGVEREAIGPPPGTEMLKL